MHPTLFSWQKERQIATPADISSHYVLFRVARQCYALPLDQVTRVLRMVAFTPVPEMPAWLSGVINMAGQTVPVIDLRRLLGQQGKEPEIQDRLLILQSSGQTIAVAVDEVQSVEEFPRERIETPNQAIAHSPIVEAIIRQDDKMIIVLNAPKLFFKRLGKVSEAGI